MSIVVTVDGHKYDVTEFIAHHPGEKPGRGIGKYSQQDISQVFQDAHGSKDARLKAARSVLEGARNGQTTDGVRYLGPVDQ